MTEKNVTNQIAKYILKENISISQIVHDTHIPKEKLLVDSTENLTAEELLELCVYLRIKPEKFI